MASYYDHLVVPAYRLLLVCLIDERDEASIAVDNAISSASLSNV
jgi:hypothetical protein